MVPLLVLCAQEPELALQRVAASSMVDIAKHTPDLAQTIVDAGVCYEALPIETIQGINKDCCCEMIQQLTQLSVSGSSCAAGALPHLAEMVSSRDGGVRRKACSALAAVAAHNGELAALVLASKVFPRGLSSLKFPDDKVRRDAAVLIREVRPQRELTRIMVPKASIIRHAATFEKSVCWW